MEANECIRTARLTPYLPGKGPRFIVEIWDTYTYDERGCTRLIARLRMQAPGARRYAHILDCGYCNGPATSDDSDESMRRAIEAVAMKPGDTDQEFFAGHTDAQLAIVSDHGETLAMEAEHRFGETDREG